MSCPFKYELQTDIDYTVEDDFIDVMNFPTYAIRMMCAKDIIKNIYKECVGEDECLLLKH